MSRRTGSRHRFRRGRSAATPSAPHSGTNGEAEGLYISRPALDHLVLFYALNSGRIITHVPPPPWPWAPPRPSRDLDDMQAFKKGKFHPPNLGLQDGCARDLLSGRRGPVAPAPPEAKGDCVPSRA